MYARIEARCSDNQGFKVALTTEGVSLMPQKPRVNQFVAHSLQDAGVVTRKVTNQLDYPFHVVTLAYIGSNEESDFLFNVVILA